jgi:hypothetical protein
MALKVMVEYRDVPLIYDVTIQEDNVYHLRLHNQENNSGDNYVPQKMVIRRKGKIWISDLEDHQELVSSLTAEIKQFRPEEENTSYM